MFSEQEEKFLSRLTKFESKQTKPLSQEYLSEMAFQLLELSNHFGVQLDETTQLTYLEKLRDLPIVKIKIACDSAIKTLKKMPLVAHLRELANEKGTDAIYGLDKPEAKNFQTQKPIFDCIRPIAREISKELVGRDYDDLDPHNSQDNLLLVVEYMCGLRAATLDCHGVGSNHLPHIPMRIYRIVLASEKTCLTRRLSCGLWGSKSS